MLPLSPRSLPLLLLLSATLLLNTSAFVAAEGAVAHLSVSGDRKRHVGLARRQFGVDGSVGGSFSFPLPCLPYRPAVPPRNLTTNTNVVLRFFFLLSFSFLFWLRGNVAAGIVGGLSQAESNLDGSLGSAGSGVLDEDGSTLTTSVPVTMTSVSSSSSSSSSSSIESVVSSSVQPSGASTLTSTPISPAQTSSSSFSTSLTASSLVISTDSDLSTSVFSTQPILTAQSSSTHILQTSSTSLGSSSLSPATTVSTM